MNSITPAPVERRASIAVLSQTGRAFGHFEATGVRPACMERLHQAGVRLPANLFAARVLGR